MAERVIPKFELVNLTPHELQVQTMTNEVISIPPSGTVARCAQFETIDKRGPIDFSEALIQITKQSFGEVEGVPEPVEGTFFIVSRLVATALPERKDLLIPGPLVRDEEGKVIGCKGLSAI